MSDQPIRSHDGQGGRSSFGNSRGFSFDSDSRSAFGNARGFSFDSDNYFGRSPTARHYETKSHRFHHAPDEYDDFDDDFDNDYDEEDFMQNDESFGME